METSWITHKRHIDGPDRTMRNARPDAGWILSPSTVCHGFREDVVAGQSPAIQLDLDATPITRAFSGSGYVQTIARCEHSSIATGAPTSHLRGRDKKAMDVLLGDSPNDGNMAA
jgi:hypothetical protein